VSGCICILLAWDEPRRELIRKLTALGLPLLVLVVTDAATARQVTGETEDDRPSDFHVFAAGRIEEGLLRLGRTAA
jgi:hypothetical protein